MFWMMAILFPFAMTALVTWWWYKKSGMARGQVEFFALYERLADD
jgi:hypothetical protein